MIKLTEEKRISILNDFLFDRKETNRLILLDMGAKAQLKKVAEWGLERCPHWAEGLTKEANVMKRDCGQCWQVLFDEVKDV